MSENSVAEKIARIEELVEHLKKSTAGQRSSAQELASIQDSNLAEIQTSIQHILMLKKQSIRQIVQEDYDLACLYLEATANRKRPILECNHSTFNQLGAFKFIEDRFGISLSKSDKMKLSLPPSGHECKRKTKKRFSYLEMYQDILGEILALSQSPAILAAFGSSEQNGLNRESARKRMPYIGNHPSWAQLFVRNFKF